MFGLSLRLTIAPQVALDNVTDIWQNSDRPAAGEITCTGLFFFSFSPTVLCIFILTGVKSCRHRMDQEFFFSSRVDGNNK